MKEIKNSKGNIVKIYAETFEYEAYDQVKKLSNYGPYLDSKIRIMPDAHAGAGCTVGTTMTISDKLTPNLVGVDIGCGMLSIELKDRDINLQKLDEIINTKVPSGFNIHSTPQADFDFSNLRCQKHVDLSRAAHSIGSLGGGNHFIELSKGEDSYYLIIHSGSRKLGGDTCKYYQNLAFQNLNEMGKIKAAIVEKLTRGGRQKDIQEELKKVRKPATDKELAHLQGEDFDDYLNDMRIVQQFASLNREKIAEIIIREMGFSPRSKLETIHNYIDFKRMILRKGAVSAEEGEPLLIPINMRDGSLLCVGKGNEEWNYSAPHGAGRLMSRSKAKEQIKLDDFTDSMTGIYSSSVGQSTLDEAPQAYKSIEEIMEAIKDTVDIIKVLKPVYNFKAH